MNFDPKKDKIRHCEKCRKIMIIKDCMESLNEYVASLGYKETDKWYHKKCLFI